MEYQVSYEVRSRYLLVRMAGRYDPVGARELFDAVRARAVEENLHHIFIHALEVGDPETELDRYLMGEAIAEMLPLPFKVAILYKPNYDKFTENAAVVRGADVLICSDPDEALQWLLEDGECSPSGGQEP
jgi:hypothetical protein